MVTTSGGFVLRVSEPGATELTRVIWRLHADSDGVYGSRTITADLRDDFCQCGRHKVARLMRKAGLKGCPKRRNKVTTQRDPSHPVRTTWEQDFTAEGPNERWASDITHLNTAGLVVSGGGDGSLLETHHRLVYGSLDQPPPGNRCTEHGD